MSDASFTPSFSSRDAAMVVETHISVVTFVGDRVYKLKKPVDLGFLDFSSREERERLCHREVELNRRLAPDVYLGVADLSVGKRVCDHLVVMRRMPEDRRLSALVTERDPSTAEAVDEIARLLADFHSRAERSPAIDGAARPSMVRSNWEESFHQMEPFVGEVLDEATSRRVQTLVRRYLDGRAALLDERVASGRACDGHGDLQAADIFCLADGPRVLDCIEFADRFRHGDVLADVAFLAMDLERLGSPDLAGRFLDRYQRFAGEVCPASLVHHYIAYRAHVRAKVACLRARQLAGDEPARTRAAEEAVALLALSHRHLEEGRIRLILVGGLPGTGKSTLARHLGERLGWSVIRSDEVRREHADRSGGDRSPPTFGAGPYTPEMTDRVYDALLARARIALEHGVSVVLDASWTDGERRAAARRLAADAVADLAELECRVSTSVADSRMVRRGVTGQDPSEATPPIARQMREAASAWPESVVVDTEGSEEESLDRALELLDRAG